MRIGIGYDIHRLVKGRPLVMGGIEIPFPKGLEGHSDADVLLHAICDSILGAVGAADIGSCFPDTDPRFKGVSSKELLREVRDIMDNRGFRVGNLDCIVIAEAPRIRPYTDRMAAVISDILRVTGDALSIKGRTGEKVGVIGEGKAIAAHAAVLLVAKQGGGE
ncbi:MAG: 2-C-methyl-D-erythritol 2,4-cyclodiphosphate synthase [Candidatus Omnitrophica bacterium]|nr:2-C-methyl-D-erythritol 2,4-cyclodiphosphate synthase [Candidatus Omnitrophota bacterium]